MGFLKKAVRDYHPGKEASFVTFAQMCIDRQIYSAVQSSNNQKHMPLNTYISLSQEDEESPLAQAWVETQKRSSLTGRIPVPWKMKSNRL